MNPNIFKKKSKEFAEVEIEIDPKDVVKKKELGSGCYKTVYIGECSSKEVAIGVPRMQKLSAEQRTSLLNEIRIMKNNPHPNIILFMGAVTKGKEFQIITELLDGDLEHLLQSEGKKMSLYERLLLAKDAALGMNWLHKSQPAIIHRDLKTANLLYAHIGDVYQVKVCDFGLSDIKPKRATKLRDPEKEGAKGTPLYMAPEVMMGKDFDEKADVYSYAMCLWEIYTCEDLFPNHNDYDEFVSSICKKGERPPIPDDCLPSLRKLLEDCWHAKAKNRPSFSEINDRLDTILVEAAISDKEGQEFWKNNFLKKRRVKWDEFSKAFYKFINVSRPYDEESDDKKKKRNKKPAVVVADEDVITLRCLKALTVSSDKESVEIQWFGNILNWFGPLTKSTDGKNADILSRLHNICKQPWFHGDLDLPETLRRINAANVPGTYLVRFSTSSPGAFTITRVTKDKQIAHARVNRTSNGGFTVIQGTVHQTLDELIKFLSSDDVLGLKDPCPGSKFLTIFAKEVIQDDYMPVAIKLG